MTLRVAIQMDPIGSIKTKTDSTLLLGLEAQKRGYELYYYTPDKLAWREGALTASVQRITFSNDPVHYYRLGETQKLDLKTMDVILLRQDPPFDMSYLTTTYMLEKLHPKPLVVNSPKGVRDLPEKIFPTLLGQFMPPTLITADIEEIRHFRDEHKDIVIKPLYGYAGRSVIRLKAGDDNFGALMEVLFSSAKEPWVVQAFLPEVKTGDRRIVMIGGKVSAIMGRIPAEGDIRGNFRVGGSPAKASITPKQHEICEALGPLLEKHGLIFAGIDVIGDWLTEVNITSPTGLPALNQLYGLTLEADIWNSIESQIKSR